MLNLIYNQIIWTQNATQTKLKIKKIKKQCLHKNFRKVRLKRKTRKETNRQTKHITSKKTKKMKKIKLIPSWPNLFLWKIFQK